MIEVFPVDKLKIDSLDSKERLFVCFKEKGGVLRIMGLRKYLKAGQGRLESRKSVDQKEKGRINIKRT